MEVMHAFTYRRAIEDGFLVNVSELAKTQCGIYMPTAVTAELWREFVCVASGSSCESENDRLLRIIGGFRANATFANIGLDGISWLFQRLGRQDRSEPLFKAVCGPGDDESLVIIIMLPHDK